MEIKQMMIDWFKEAFFIKPSVYMQLKHRYHIIRYGNLVQNLKLLILSDFLMILISALPAGMGYLVGLLPALIDSSALALAVNMLSLLLTIVGTTFMVIRYIIENIDDAGFVARIMYGIIDRKKNIL